MFESFFNKQKEPEPVRVKQEPLNQCPFVVGSITNLIKSRVDFEFTVIEATNTKNFWRAYGNAIVKLPGASAVQIIANVSKNGYVESFSIHYQIGLEVRCLIFGKDWTNHDSGQEVKMVIEEVIVK